MLRNASKLDPTNIDYLNSLQHVSSALGINLDHSPAELSDLEVQQIIERLLHRNTAWEFGGEKSTKIKKETHEIPNFEKFKPSCTCLVISDFFPPHDLNKDDYFLQNLYNFMLENNEIEVDIRFLVSRYISIGYRKFKLFPLPYPNLYRELKIRSGDTNSEMRSSISTYNISVLDKHIKAMKPNFILTWNMDNFTDTFRSTIYSLKLPIIDKHRISKEIDKDSLDGLPTLLSNELK